MFSALGTGAPALAAAASAIICAIGTVSTPLPLSTVAAIGTVSSSTAATGIGSPAGAGLPGSTPLRSDLHCSQNSAPSSFSKLQNGHFTMTLSTSRGVLLFVALASQKFKVESTKSKANHTHFGPYALDVTSDF